MPNSKLPSNTVRMCDMPITIAALVLEKLNPGHIRCDYQTLHFELEIYSDVEPRKLRYPEGWYFAKGCFRNKHMSSTGFYSEARMLKPNGEQWDEPYCTLYLNNDDDWISDE